jgi:hypothetical protein
LEVNGLKHSGDFTSAPFAKGGARETIEVDLADLHKKCPEAAHIAILVFAYSGQDMDDLYDASVFVADPSCTGSGPGGTRILSAARLTGKGKVNVAGFVSVEQASTTRAPRQYLTCVDATMGFSNASAASSKDIVSKTLKRLTRAAAQQERRLNLAQLSAMQAVAMGADEIIVLHGSAEAGDFETYRRPISSLASSDRQFDFPFFESVCDRLGELTPATAIDFSKLEGTNTFHKDAIGAKVPLLAWHVLFFFFDQPCLFTSL